MSRLFGWDLPPGCTQRDIDAYYGTGLEEGEEDEETEVSCAVCGVSMLESEAMHTKNGWECVYHGRRTERWWRWFGPRYLSKTAAQRGGEG